MMSFIESIAQYNKALENLKNYGIFAGGHGHNDNYIQLPYKEFLKVSDGQDITVARRKCEIYPYSLSFEVNGCKVITIIDEIEAVHLGLDVPTTI